MDSGEPTLTGITVVNLVVEDINDNLPSFDQLNISIEELELTSVSNFSFKVRCTNICLLIQVIYTYRQKLSNSKLVLNVKNCSVRKYWKFKFHYNHLASFEKRIIATDRRYYVTNVKAGMYGRLVCSFHKMSLTFRKGIYFESYVRSYELSEGNRIVFLGNPREKMCQRKGTLC